MDTTECQPLYLDIQEFYEGFNMKVEQPIPLLLVERQALNEAMEGEKNGTHHLPETRGLCLSEEQIIRTVLKRLIMGPGNKLIDLKTGPHRLVRRCEVTAILILYGLPRKVKVRKMVLTWVMMMMLRNLKMNQRLLGKNQPLRNLLLF
ncbi:protein DA1-related 1-like [Zingiber officinale]|uniref:protein DA1-related 1-like n=1 Tax=Zingiber officinale TaxID=94328 RepID=UPI001C4CA0DF|nr:protein DA1-related 1-like [Zingiber officinale]